jgi:16S rRNA (cytosine1402-N4)-methyltransferase
LFRRVEPAVENSAGHTPVLTRAVCELLAVRPDDFVVDATVGLAGHAVLLAGALSSQGTLLGLDVDADSLAMARRRLAESSGRIVLERRNFSELPDVLAAMGRRVDVIFADLGASSKQLDEARRGFSFTDDGPLDMRMDDRLTTSAADLVNRLREQDLANLIYENGQERRSRRIARQICTRRREQRFTRTGQLAQAVADALRVDPQSRRSKIHPATRTFQALRIAVNDELGALEALLECAPRHLKTGGRIGVISFHSLEDGRVKRDFRRRKSEGLYTIATRKPIVADTDERRVNRRSRSAKFRVAVRTENEINAG